MVGAAARLFGTRRRWPAGAGAVVFGIALALGVWLDARPADAQFLGAPAKRSRSSTTPQLLQQSRADPNAQMLVTADEIHYDYTNQRVSAVSRVQIHFAGSVLEADQVIYDQAAKRLRAEGNVRFTDADGRIIYANMLDLSEDFRDGFVDSLRLDAPDKTRIAASRAERTGGNITVFQNGVYTACEPCKEDPRRPPFWQVRAARIIHDQDEKMIYYEDARIEFHGVPLAYIPFFSTPDPTVKRKTGFLMPSAQYNSVYGFGVTTPFYWALAPNYDVTITPTVTSKQGPLLQVEWRHRLMTGAYKIRAAGIWQLDKDQFAAQGRPDSFNSGFRDFRGSIATSGQFALTDRWVWGWNATLVTDKPFLQDYSVMTRAAGNRLAALYRGRGDTSYFEARAIHYLGLSGADRQNELPIIHPVIDYDYTFGQPILGGELGYSFNLTSLSRNAADFDPINQAALVTGTCTPATADVAIKTPANCLLRGIPGSYTRFSGEAHWRRTFIDGFGQVFTPFASVRFDAATLSITNEPGRRQLHRYRRTRRRSARCRRWAWNTATRSSARTPGARRRSSRSRRSSCGPTRWRSAGSPTRTRRASSGATPICSGSTSSPAGTAWKAARAPTSASSTPPSSTAADTSTCWSDNRTSCSARTRSRSPTWRIPGSTAAWKPTRSDYVARMTFQPSTTYAFISRFRFDEETLETRRMEFESRVTFERWSLSMLYGNYDAQPDIGFLTRRQGILSSGSAKLTQNWTLYAGRALRHRSRAAQPDLVRPGLYRRLLRYQGNLYDGLRI